MNWDSQADCLKLLHNHRLKWEAAIHHSLGYLLNLLALVITLQFLPRWWLLSQNKHDADNCLESLLRGCSHNQGGLIQSLASNSAILYHKQGSRAPFHHNDIQRLQTFTSRCKKNSGRHSYGLTCQIVNRSTHFISSELSKHNSRNLPPNIWIKTGSKGG